MNFYRRKHSGETLLEFLIASLILATVVAMNVEFVLSKVQMLMFLIKDEQYIFNANSLINYTQDNERERALEFLMNTSKNNIEFKRDNNSEIFLKVYLKSSNVPVFEVGRTNY